MWEAAHCWWTRGRASGAVILCALLGCDPAAQTIVRIEPAIARSGTAGSAVVATADVETIVAIVGSVAAERGLERAAAVQPGVLVTYAPPPSQGGRTLRLSVLRATDGSSTVEISVFEWPAFRHTTH